MTPVPSLLVTEHERVLTLQLNRPQKRNALTPDMLNEMRRALTTAVDEDRVRCVVIRGSGTKAFSSGYDIQAIPASDNEEMQRLLVKQSPFEQAIERILHYPYPVIAMLNGHAFGGACDLAVACDLRIAADDIQMAMLPAKLGMVYFPDGLQRFIRLIGFSKTKELFFTGRRYKRHALKEIGLVDYLVPRYRLQSFTYEMAREIAANAPLALKGTKRIINMLAACPTLSEADVQAARLMVKAALASDDLREGRTAFFQRRKPRFKGR